MNRRSARLGLGSFAIAAALAAAGCGGSSATPQIIYVPRSAAPTPPIVYITPSAVTTPAGGEASTPADTSGPSAVASPKPTPTLAGATIASVKVTDSGTSPQCGNWTVSFAEPVASGVLTAATMNAAITAKVTGFIDDFKSKMSSGGGAGPCSLNGGFQLGSNSSTVIGITFSEVVYLGGASTGTVAGSINFLVASGATVALADLFTTPDAGAAGLSTQSRALLPAALMGDVDTAAINVGTAPAISSFDKAWAFTSSGLRLTFQELQVASAASGTPSIVIPWASLKSVINPSGPAGPFVA
jgi:hypothetical protein